MNKGMEVKRMINRDIALGTVQQIVGTAINVCGALFDDTRLQQVGALERHIGRVRVRRGQSGNPAMRLLRTYIAEEVHP